MNIVATCRHHVKPDDCLYPECRAIAILQNSVYTLNNECTQLNDIVCKQIEQIGNLASMCRRLSYSVKRSGNDKLAQECVLLLKKYNLGGSVIRNMEGPPELCPKPAPGLKIDERGVLVRQSDKDDMLTKCHICGGSLPITGRNDRTGECSCKMTTI